MKIKKPIIDRINWFKNLSKFKKVIVVITLLGLSYWGYKSFVKKDEEVSYKFTNVEIGEINNVVSETGEITSTSRTEVKSTIQGIVYEVYVQNGDWVEKGQNLFYVTSSATAAQQASAWSSYQSALSTYNSALVGEITAQANLETARVTILNQADTVDSMNDELVDGRDGITQNAIDATNSELYIDNLSFKVKEKTYLNYEQTLAAASAGLSSAWYSYQATIDGVITSPISGTVTNLAIASGQNVDVSTSDVIAANAALIKSNDQTWVKIVVNEMEISKIEVGQEAKISVDALDNEKFQSSVMRVDGVGTNNGGIVTFGIYLLIAEESEKIRPGMTVQVDIEIERKDKVLVVSNSAIKTYQGENAVQILDDETGEVLYLPVEIGSRDDINTEIISGANEGQEIIIGNSSSDNESKTGTRVMMPGMIRK
jgi:multidrug efflux pump subunit AcrA (membrane-fusion protein)